MTEKNKYPFLCGKCGNWYTPLPNFEDECPKCLSKNHAPHHKTGIIDCHFGHGSATYSERKLGEILAQVTDARNFLQRPSTQADLLSGALLRAEQRFSDVEISIRKIPEIMEWAGVMEMPGMDGEPSVARFKDIRALEDLVAVSRRPQSDLDTLKRSVSICKEMESQIGQIMAEIRVAMTELRRYASQQPQEKVVAVPQDKGKKAWTPERKRAASWRAKQAAADQRSAREPQTVGTTA